MNKKQISEDYIEYIKEGLKKIADEVREGNTLNKFDYGVITLESLITSWHQDGEDWMSYEEGWNLCIDEITGETEWKQ